MIDIEHVTQMHCKGTDHIVTNEIVMNATALRHTPPGTKMMNSTAPQQMEP